MEITHYKPTDIAFINESNRIEGIDRPPTIAEIEEHCRFLAQDEITLEDMIQFVSVYQPGAHLREHRGMNVTVGGYFPPAGDITIKTRLIEILEDANDIRGMNEARSARRIRRATNTWDSAMHYG